MGLVAVLALVASVVTWHVTQDRELSAEAFVNASSTEPGFTVRDVVDSASASSPGADWQSDAETSGAWVELSWRRAHVLRQIVLVRGALDEPGVTEGFLTFGDGSFLQVRLSANRRDTVVPLTARSVDRVRFTASRVDAGAQSVTLSEITVSDARSGDDVVGDDEFGGNAAGSAAVTDSSGASGPHVLQDGSAAPGAAGVGAEWTTDRPIGSWVQMDWDSPRELSSIQLVGSTGSAASVAAATITFGDGAQLPVGAVLPAPDRPTVVSFMPRVTRSVRLTVDRVDKPGPLRLAEMRIHQRGSTPLRLLPAASVGPAPKDIACTARGAGTPPVTGLSVRCPTTGSTVDGNVAVQLAAPAGYSTITASIWPGNGSESSAPPLHATPDESGVASMIIDAGSVPPGPFTVRFEATGEGQEAEAVNFQLYRSAPGTADDVDSGAPPAGRTLAYSEEFDRPLSISRTGANADYTAAKPVRDGAEDFGEAIFADPAQGFDTVGVVDNRFLRIDVEPSPAGYADPQGWGRTHLGGLLASARQGGSGFSAQYGYFEARMLLPAAPGTWPAFWMLPSDNLVAPTTAVAEIDALEHYGHNPQGACHSTHEYKNARDDGVALCGQRFPDDRAALAWHTYGVSITPTENTFFIDGQVVATAPQVDGGGAPMFFLVNLALGGGWPKNLAAVQDRAVLYVDHVRVYV